MIKIKLASMMDTHNIYTDKELSERTGINQNTIGKMKKNISKQIDLRVLDTLCTFFECKPGELIDHIED